MGRFLFHITIIKFALHFGSIFGDIACYRSIINDCQSSGHNISKTTVPGLISCCSLCLGDERCLSVSYKESNGNCVSHDDCLYNCTRFGTEETGWSVLCRAAWKFRHLELAPKMGVYTIFPTRETGIQVFCDMTTEGGGWTVFQRRLDGSINFERHWKEYKTGFGNPGGEYWIGNDHLNGMTKQGSCKLRIDMITLADELGYAEYSNFTIGSEQEGYALNYSQYLLGTAGDSLSDRKGQKFTTMDRDNDGVDGENCAEEFHGAWWYQDCRSSNLNSRYGKSYKGYLRWPIWDAGSEAKGYLKEVKMMVKC